MSKIKAFFKKSVVKYGSAIAAFAFMLVSVAANTSCWLPYYEPAEPNGISKFKKFED